MEQCLAGIDRAKYPDPKYTEYIEYTQYTNQNHNLDKYTYADTNLFFLYPNKYIKYMNKHRHPCTIMLKMHFLI